MVRIKKEYLIIIIISICIVFSFSPHAFSADFSLRKPLSTNLGREETRLGQGADADVRTQDQDRETHISLSGERNCDIVYDRALFDLFPQDVRETIELLISTYPKNWPKNVSYELVGTEGKTRTIKIHLDEPVVFNGEEIDTIYINGILFEKEDLGKEWLGANVGSIEDLKASDLPRDELEKNVRELDFAPDGRVVRDPYLHDQIRGIGAKEARNKFVHSRDSLPKAGIRSSIALGYGYYQDLETVQNPLGCFIYGTRKGEPERYANLVDRQLHEFYARFEREVDRLEQEVVSATIIMSKSHFQAIDKKGIASDIYEDYDFYELYWRYGRALRELNDRGIYPKYHHHGNMVYDDEQDTVIWYDVGLWKMGKDLTIYQKVGYRYNTLVYGSMAVSRDIGTPGLTLAYIYKFLNPDHAFLEGYFYDRTEDDMFDLEEFQVYREGRTSLEIGLLNIDDKRPVHLRFDAPFLPLIRILEGLDPTAHDDNGAIPVSKPDRKGV